MNKVLFACSQNAGRSQIAQAVFNKIAAEKGIEWEAESSGIVPVESLYSNVKQVLEENSLDTSHLTPKKIDFKNLDQFSKVISFGCIVKSRLRPEIIDKFEEWFVEDPHNASAKRTDKIYNEIYAKVEDLVGRLEG